MTDGKRHDSGSPWQSDSEFQTLIPLLSSFMQPREIVRSSIIEKVWAFEPRGGRLNGNQIGPQTRLYEAIRLPFPLIGADSPSNP